MGFRPTGSVADRVLAAGLILLDALALSRVATGIGLIAKSVESASVLGSMLFLPHLSSVRADRDDAVGSAGRQRAPADDTRHRDGPRPAHRNADRRSGWLALASTVGVLTVAAAGSSPLYRRRNLV